MFNTELCEVKAQANKWKNKKFIKLPRENILRFGVKQWIVFSTPIMEIGTNQWKRMK